MFNTLRHLLPQGRAWALKDGTNIEKFMRGLGAGLGDTRSFIDQAYAQINPATTDSLSKWEEQFNLKSASLTEQERRDNLQSAWAATGGQSPRYLQDTIRAAGFDVYVHEWWEPGTEPAIGVQGSATARNPNLYLRRSATALAEVDCGEAFAECGEEIAECGEYFDVGGVPLANKILQTIATPSGVTETSKIYEIPLGSEYFPFFVYIGAETFPDPAVVSAARQEEFEALLLKIFPLHLWIGLLINYQ